MQVVESTYGITGYFVEAMCGANCGDAHMWWIYEAYRYMPGMKAGGVEDVAVLAKAAMVNATL